MSPLSISSCLSSLIPVEAFKDDGKKISNLGNEGSEEKANISKRRTAGRHSTLDVKRSFLLAAAVGT